MEARSKKEIIHDIEDNRRDARKALRGTKYAITDGNPAVRGWRRTKNAAIETKERVVEKAQLTKAKLRVKAEATDLAVREKIYRSLAVAVCLGALAGFLAKKKFKARAESRCC